MLSSLSTTAKKSAPACWQELRSVQDFDPKISEPEKPANLYLKPTACGTHALRQTSPALARRGLTIR